MEKNNKVENNTLYTRCPTCSTAFKVTDKLLAAARGKVRCGACLAIFQATDYMLKPSEQNLQSNALKPSQAQAERQPVEPQQVTNEQIISNADSETEDVTEVEIESEPDFDNSSPYRPASNFDTQPDFETEPNFEEDTPTKETPQFEFVEDLLSEPGRPSNPNIDEDLIDQIEPEFEKNAHYTADSQFESEPDFDTELPEESEVQSLDFESTKTDQEPAELMHSSDEQALSISDEEITDPQIDIDVVTDISEELNSHELEEPEISQENDLDDDNQSQSFDFDEHSSEVEDDLSHIEQEFESEALDGLDSDNNDIEASEQQSIESSRETNEFNDSETDITEAEQTEISQLDPELVESEQRDPDYLDSNHIEPEFNETDLPDSEIPESETFEVDNNRTEDLEDLGLTTENLDEHPESYQELSGQLAEQMQETDSEPDPLDEFEKIVEENHSGIKTKLITAVVGILLVIFFQQVWSNRQSLAWSETWGGTIKSFCNFLPCELQAKRDISAIELLQRQLGPDEELENMLDIKVLLINKANFEQPYPTIRIAFSDKNSDPVYEKAFPPEYYLEADAKDSLMPSNSEIHIHFKTEHSHPDALGFEISFE